MPRRSRKIACTTKASQRFEEGLKAIGKGLGSKSGTKKRDKVNERLGRLKEHYAAIQNDYEITFTYDEKNTVTAMDWKRKEEKTLVRSSSQGKYIVQTTLTGHTEEQIWSCYNVIRHVEACFETLKSSDLDIRPIFHQKDEATKAHFHLAILAYWIVSTTQYQLKKKGVSLTWGELLRIMGTLSVVSTRAKRADGNEVEVRQCTEPEQRLADIYLKLNLNSPPLKRRRKICVVHLENIKKTGP